MAFQLTADDGTPLDAHFEVDGASIVFHSRGGSGKRQKNVDYSRALRLLLERLALAQAPVERAWVDSSPVQSIPIANRIILHEGDAGATVAEKVSRMGSRMQAIGRKPDSKSDHGNSNKRIRLQLPAGTVVNELLAVLGVVPTKQNFRSDERLPATELARVTPEHLWRAVQRLIGGFTPKGFEDSTDYDVLLEDNVRLPPKALFGLAATEALGFEVLPKHFVGGIGSPCFRLLEDSGYTIVRKDGESPGPSTPAPRTDRDPEYTEGSPRLQTHLRRERKAGLREAKKAEFRRTHGGKLFCERCQMDPIDAFGGPDGEACIEVHHWKVQIQDMPEGHITRLEDLQCLCANCHRFVHRLLRKAADPPTTSS